MHLMQGYTYDYENQRQNDKRYDDERLAFFVVYAKPDEHFGLLKNLITTDYGNKDISAELVN